MEKRHEGLEAGGQHPVEEAVVEGEPGRIQLADPVGQDPGPSDGEAVRAEAEVPHELDVFRPAVVVVAGEVACLAVVDGAWSVRELLPDAPSGTVGHW
jgi:hypothetical protein